MDLHDLARLARNAGLGSLTDAHRAIRLRFGQQVGELLQPLLLPQRIDIAEALFDGLSAEITCLAPRADLPLAELLGLPIEIQLVTDRGELRRFAAIVTACRQGQSDGALTVVHLSARDALAVLDNNRRSRVYTDLGVREIVRQVLDEWRSGALSACFDWRDDCHDPASYPRRAFTLQINESDAAFVRRLLRRHGICWYFEPGRADAAQPTQRLVLTDRTPNCAANAAGAIRLHRRDGTEPRDTIGQLAADCRLVAGAVARSSWDYKRAASFEVGHQIPADQGRAGAALSRALRDARIDVPHAAADWYDYQRHAERDAHRHAWQARLVRGVGSVRDLAAGQYNEIRDWAPLEGQADAAAREHLMLRVEHWGTSNLPKELHGRAAALLGAEAAHAPAWAAGESRGSGAEQRYANRFVALPRGVAVYPDFDPLVHLPRPPLLTATIAGAQGEEVWCDALGRYKVRIEGLDSGADSAWIRLAVPWAGAGFGTHFPLRVGMEVTLAFMGGDPDRPVIAGSAWNRDHEPAAFAHQPSLPHNRYLSGIVSREIRGTRQQQLRWDDTPGEISVQLASDHGHTQLNLGHLGHPRIEGHSEPRGEGVDLRTDESGAFRTAKAMLLSTYARLLAQGRQLDMREHVALLEQALELLGGMTARAEQHQAPHADLAAEKALKSDVVAASGGSNVDPRAEGGAPTLNLAAAAGIAATTPNTIVHYAGTNLTSVAQQHLHLAAGQRLHVNAGQGISLFAHHEGLRATAQHGNLQLQSQHGDTLLDSAQNTAIRAIETVNVSAKEICLVADDGSFIKIGGGGITLGTRGSIESKAAGFPHSGPATMSADLPAFGDGAADQRFVLQHHPGGEHATPAADAPYLIELSDGTQVRGTSDAQGRTQLLARDAMHIARVTLLPRSDA